MKNTNLVLIPIVSIILVLSLLLAYEYNKPDCARAGCVDIPGPPVIEGWHNAFTSAGARVVDRSMGTVGAGTQTRYCFLSHYEANDIEDSDEYAICHVRLTGSGSSAQWHLTATANDGDGTDADVHCSAYCVLFD